MRAACAVDSEAVLDHEPLALGQLAEGSSYALSEQRAVRADFGAVLVVRGQERAQGRASREPTPGPSLNGRLPGTRIVLRVAAISAPMLDRIQWKAKVENAAPRFGS